MTEKYAARLGLDGFYATAPGTEARAAEEKIAAEQGLKLGEMKQIEAMGLGMGIKTSTCLKSLGSAYMDYMEQFGADGYNSDTFVDFVVGGVVQPPNSDQSGLIAWYRERAAALERTTGEERRRAKYGGKLHRDECCASPPPRGPCNCAYLDELEAGEPG